MIQKSEKAEETANNITLDNSNILFLADVWCHSADEDYTFSKQQHLLDIRQLAMPLLASAKILFFPFF